MVWLFGDRHALSWIAVALAIYLAARLAPSPAGLSHTGQAVLGVALAGVALWASEAVPLGFAFEIFPAQNTEFRTAQQQRAEERGDCGGESPCRKSVSQSVTDSVILYPVQTASNLIAYETGYFRGADVGRLGAVMLGLTILVGLGVAIPYWEVLGLRLLSP